MKALLSVFSIILTSAAMAYGEPKVDRVVCEQDNNDGLVAEILLNKKSMKVRYTFADGREYDFIKQEYQYHRANSSGVESYTIPTFIPGLSGNVTLFIDPIIGPTYSGHGIYSFSFDIWGEHCIGYKGSEIVMELKRYDEVSEQVYNEYEYNGPFRN